VSISPTFYEQLLHQNPLAKKITNPNFKHIKAVEKTFVKKAAHKILVKLAPGGRILRLIYPNPKTCIIKHFTAAIIAVYTCHSLPP
jgi:hypothetical protein